MRQPWLFAAVACAAVAAGLGLWWSERPSAPRAAPVQISAAALYAATFRDPDGQPQALGRFQGRPLVLNFWATWCTPCREEMPAFARLQSRWRDRVSFVGVADDDPARVRAFGRELAIPYALWVGGPEVGELARRLGNEAGVLPFTVVLNAEGSVVAQKVGAYTELELEAVLHQVAGG